MLVLIYIYIYNVMLLLLEVREIVFGLLYVLVSLMLIEYLKILGYMIMVVTGGSLIRISALGADGRV